MTFKFYSKFNTSLKEETPKFTNFSYKPSKGANITKTKELGFDTSRIHVDFKKHLQVGMQSDYGNVGRAEVKDKFDGYLENNRNSKLMGYVRKFENGARGTEPEGCEVGEFVLGVGGGLLGAAGGLANGATYGALLGGGIGFVGGQSFAQKLCEEGADLGDAVYGWFNGDDEATTDTPEAEEDSSSTPASEQEKETVKDSTDEPQDDGSDEEPNECSPKEEGDGSDGEPNQSLPEDGQEGGTSTQSNNPIDEGQGGNNEEADSSVGDLNSDINWGPDGQGGGGENSSYGGPIDELDPITNWGPDGREGDGQFKTSLGIDILDTHTNWSDSQSNMHVISDFSEILGNIDPTHNDSNYSQTSFVNLMAAIGSDFF